MTTQELIDYYKNLLIIQYHGLPKASGMVEAFIKELIADQIYLSVRDGFNIDTAIGKQLDTLGSYIGANRQYVGLNLERQYFALPDYDDDLTGIAGLADYDEDYSEADWYFLTYEDQKEPYTLSDEELRKLIKFRAKINSSDHSTKSIDDIIFEFLSYKVTYFDLENMTLLYVYIEESNSDFFNILFKSQSLPKPAGVRIFAVKSESIDSFFAFGDYDEETNSDTVGLSDYDESYYPGTFLEYP